MPRLSDLVCLVVVLPCAAACSKSKPAAPTAAAHGDAGATAAVAPKPAAPVLPTIDAAPPTAIAAPAPTYCDGKPCPCKAGTSEHEKYQECELEKPLIVQGVPCDAGHLGFHPDGKLAECQLTAHVIVDGIECRVGVGIWLYPNGRLKRCNVGGKLQVGDFALEDTRFGAFDLELFDDGSLKEGTLAAPRVIGGKPCRRDVSLYKNGAPYSCDLDAPLVVGKRTLPEGTPTMWSRDGTKVLGYFPQEDMPRDDGGVDHAGNPVCLVKDCNSIPSE